MHSLNTEHDLKKRQPEDIPNKQPGKGNEKICV